MKFASTVIAAGLIASLFYFNIESARAVVTMLSGVVATSARLDVFSTDGGLNVFTLLLIALGFICFNTIRGK